MGIIGRRFLAWLIDFVLVITVLGALLYSAFTAVLDDAFGTGLKALLKGDAGVVVDALWPIVGACLAAAGIQFAYQSLGLRLRGQTLGKALLDLRVRSRKSSLGNSSLTWSRAARRAALTTLAETGLWSLACVVLFLGLPLLSFAVWLLGVAVFAVNLTPLPGARRRTVIDRMAGTVVGPAATLQAVVRNAVEGAQLGRERVETALRSEPARRLSARAQDTMGKTRESVSRAQVTQRAVQTGAEVGGKAKRLWAEQRAKRTSPQPPPAELSPPAMTPPPAGAPSRGGTAGGEGTGPLRPLDSQADGVAEAQPSYVESPPDRTD